jgi:hypothetical protein
MVQFPCQMAKAVTRGALRLVYPLCVGRQVDACFQQSTTALSALAMRALIIDRVPGGPPDHSVVTVKRRATKSDMGRAASTEIQTLIPERTPQSLHVDGSIQVIDGTVKSNAARFILGLRGKGEALF